MEEFLTILDRILSQVAAFNVRPKPSKWFFGLTSIEFLEHIFGVSRVRLSNAQVKEIQEFPERTSVKGVRSFIGMVNYFRDFIKGLSSYMITPTALTKKNSAS